MPELQRIHLVHRTSGQLRTLAVEEFIKAAAPDVQNCHVFAHALEAITSSYKIQLRQIVLTETIAAYGENGNITVEKAFQHLVDKMNQQELEEYCTKSAPGTTPFVRYTQLKTTIDDTIFAELIRASKE